MKLVTLTALFLIPFVIYSVTRTVSLDGTQQYTSIQAAVNVCSNGDIVLVYPGRYIENIDLNGHSVSILSLYFQSPQQTYIDSTIIDGNLNTCITLVQGETLTVNGFTLVNNEQNQYYEAQNSGGAFNIKNNCHANISNCIIRNCTAKYGGGITSDTNTIIELSNVIVHSNYANSWGGGFRLGAVQLIWDADHPSSVYDNVAPFGMDFYIGYCPTSVNIQLALGSIALNNIDNFYIYCTDNYPSPNVSIDQSFFTLVDNDIYVSPAGNDNNDGLAPSNPYKTIKHALQVINSNQDNPRTIHLAAGVYSNTENGQVFPLAIKSFVSIIGSGEGNTILDGLQISSFFGGYHISDINISGISFINGWTYSTVVAPLILKSSHDIELRDLVFSNCNSYLCSGITLSNCYNVVIDHVQAGNTTAAEDMATISVWNSYNVYINNVISIQNHITNSDYNMLGLFFDESGIVLRNSMITNNSAQDAYAFYYQNILSTGAQQDNTLDMSNVLISNNSITQSSWVFSPIYIQSRFQAANINNCTFAGNQGLGTLTKIFAYAEVNNLVSYNPQFNSELFLHNYLTDLGIQAEVNINNSLFRSNSIASDLPNLVTINDCIFNGNPLFQGNTNDSLLITQPEYYYLSANSPCINTGTADTTGMNLPDTDLAGNYRVWDNRIDMGCYEYGAPPVANDDNTNPPLPDRIMLSTYPNPVYLNSAKGAYTFIEFTLPERAKEQPVIEIYNLKGQKIRTIKLTDSFNSLVRKAGLSELNDQDGRSTSEFYSTVWDCKDERSQKISSGIYIVKVRSGKHQTAIKMTILK